MDQGLSVKGRARIAACHAAGRVSPVQGRVNRQQVRQVVAIGIHEIIDPFDAHRPVCLRFDGQRGRVVDQQALLAG